MDDADQGVEEFGALFYEECSKKKKKVHRLISLEMKNRITFQSYVEGWKKIV